MYGPFPVTPLRLIRSRVIAGTDSAAGDDFRCQTNYIHTYMRPVGNDPTSPPTTRTRTTNDVG